MKRLFLALLATGALAMSACERNNAYKENRTDRTGTSVDQTSGTVGMSADTSSSGSASTGTATADTTGTATMDTAMAAGTHKTHSKKKVEKKSEETKAQTGSSGAYIPPAEKPAASTQDPTINEPVVSDTVSSDSSSYGTMSAADAAPIEDKMDQANLEAEAEARLMKSEAQAKYYEPQSLTPDKTGTTSLTGEDRSHAQAARRKGTFVDPTVAPKRDTALSTAQPIETIDMARYPYNKRHQFRGAMEDRLGMIDERIGAMKTAENRETMKSIEARQTAAERKLKQAGKVDASQWEGYKMEFRDQVAEIERSLDLLSTAKR